MSAKEFSYKLPSNVEAGCLNVELEPPNGADIQFECHENGKKIWITANQKGWLHLAKVFAELGLREDLDEEYHVHRSFEFKDSTEEMPEVTLGIIK